MSKSLIEQLLSDKDIIEAINNMKPFARTASSFQGKEDNFTLKKNVSKNIDQLISQIELLEKKYSSKN
jgi:hypothetical protein